MTTINKTTLLQYMAVFGAEKMKLLWQEFRKSTENNLKNIENRPPEEIRLYFHALRSSSLVFGLDELSKNCELIEEAVISGEKIAEIKKYIDKTKKLFYNACESVNILLDNM